MDENWKLLRSVGWVGDVNRINMFFINFFDMLHVSLLPPIMKFVNPWVTHGHLSRSPFDLERDVESFDVHPDRDFEEFRPPSYITNIH